MPSFPWDQLKAETLRAMCRDLGAGPGTKRKRDDMISFLKDIENRGLTATLQQAKPAKVDAAGSSDSDAASEPTRVSEPAEKPPSPVELEDDHDTDTTVSDVALEPVNTTCQCQGWLSPRMKFLLSVTAGVASDLVLDTGEMAEELGHAGGVYLTEYIPARQVPRGKKAVVLWIEGFATIFGVIHKMFEAGEIPTAGTLERALSQLPKDKQKLIKAYGKQGAKVESVLEALVYGAKDEWEEDFKAKYGDDKEWKALPVCAEHDMNWDLAVDMLAK